MACTTALPLQQFIASLDNSCLPKILQVCSGVYFQGSIYEISGSEVSFSTGDLIKVTRLELLSVLCEDVSNNESFELPINHTGLFRVVPEQMPYGTVEEMVRLRPVGLDSSLPFTFASRCAVALDDFTLGPGRALTVLSTERLRGHGDRLRCQIQGQQDASAVVHIPLSTRGEFYVCPSKECFTLQEIMSSPSLRSQRFNFINTTNSERPLLLSPVYEIHAAMNLRKNALKFPSSLEMDVIDVTDTCKEVNFITPLGATEVFSLPDECFPAVVEILEGQERCSLFRCSWLPELKKNKRLIFHRKGTSAMILISSLKSRKAVQYFLVSQQYGGRFRRQPREFSSVLELYTASTAAPGLRVNVTRNCEKVEEEGLPALSVGEQLEVVRCDMVELPCGGSKGERQSVEALVCKRLQELDDGDDDEDDDDDEEEVEQKHQTEEIYLPVYMPGHFMEVLSENKKYRLTDVVKKFNLPLEVKVVSRDAELEPDPLVGFPRLRIEGATLEPSIQASFLNMPGRCFEIPTQRLNLSVGLTGDALPWPIGHPPKCQIDTVTEVTDTFFYKFQQQVNSGAAPPPRPPKRDMSKPRKVSPSTSRKNSPGSFASTPVQEFHAMSLDRKRRPPVPPPQAFEGTKALTCQTHKSKPNTYTAMKESAKNSHAADEDSDHDYEPIDETLDAMAFKGIKPLPCQPVKGSAAKMPIGKSKPNAYAAIKKPAQNRQAADEDSDHDYEPMDAAFDAMVRDQLHELKFF